MENELIVINEKNGIQSVSARELYKKLEIATAFKDWFPRMCEYGFTEGEDFSSFLSESNGGRPAKEYAISIEMAKQICMLQKSDKGKQYREYFIKLEIAWNSPEMVMKRALEFANRNVEEMKKRLLEQQPKVDFFDAVADSKDAMDMSNVAKILDCGMGRNQIFDILRNNGVLQQNNVPYQRFVDAGLFRVIEQKYSASDGSVHINIKTLVYQKGIDYIRKVIKCPEKEDK
jgi:anti-repressor protein